jgi:hypothetical protein
MTKDLPGQLQQLAITGCQSNETELVQALSSAADEIRIYHKLIDEMHEVGLLIGLVMDRFEYQEDEQ